MALVTQNFANQIERFSQLKAESLRNDAILKIESEKAAIYETTIKELESEKQNKLEKLENIERILATTKQQADQYLEDITTNEQMAYCFKMRSVADCHDDETDFQVDAERRERLADAKTRRTCAAIDRLRAMASARSSRALQQELRSMDRSSLAQYMQSSAAIVAKCEQLIGGATPAAAVAATGTAGTDADEGGRDDGGPCPRELVEQLKGLLAEHLECDEDGNRLADHAADQVSELKKRLAQRRMMLSMHASAVGVDVVQLEEDDDDMEIH